MAIFLPISYRSFGFGVSSNAEAVGLVRTHWPSLARSCGSSFFFDPTAKITRTPGRPSGVSSGDRIDSIPASAGAMITEVPKPVVSAAVIRAHSSL